MDVTQKKLKGTKFVIDLISNQMNEIPMINIAVPQFYDAPQAAPPPSYQSYF